MNKKFVLGVILVGIFSGFVFAAPKYISPNNDGVKDVLELKVKIEDNSRPIQSWTLIISDEEGNVVYEENNKDPLYDKLDFKSFFKRLITPKKGALVPEIISWSGRMSKDEKIAPDGLYYYQISASDDNDNIAISDKRIVYVDTKAPEINLIQPKDKIFGEGAKSTIKIQQSGSEEELWTGTFKSADGTIVKTIKWENSEPKDFIWDGTSDLGNQVADGIYTYEITSTDRAGNKSPVAEITNIIYSGDKPFINIFVEGSKYFSPKTESKLDKIVFNLSIQIPEESTGNKLLEWNVSVKDNSGKVVRSYNQENSGTIPPDSLIFDGLDNNGKVLPDGKYQASVNAKYLNGYEPMKISSSVIVLDREKPIVQITTPAEKIFGAGKKNTITFDISPAPSAGAPIKKWTGEIKNKLDNAVVKSYDWEINLPEKITWDGSSVNGNIAESGQYIFKITGEDLAGNIGEQTSDEVIFDNTETNLNLIVDSSAVSPSGVVAFSPNGDNTKDTIIFNPETKTRDIVSYKFEIKNKDNSVVYSKGENGNLPRDFEWNGKGNDKIICDDGEYTAYLQIEAANGSSASASTQSFILDTEAPNIATSIPWNKFSTSGNGNQKNIPITFTSCTPEKQWNMEIRKDKNTTIATYSWSGAKDSFVWDGTDEAGNIIEDGVYSILIYSTDDAGNKFETEIEDLILDNRETRAYITTEYTAISPNNDNVFDTQIFNINISVTDDILSWKFNVVDENNNPVYSLSEKESEVLPSQITWNGADKDGNPCEGTYKATLDIVYHNSNFISVESSTFLSTTKVPQLKVQTAPKYFSPDNDGVDDDLYIKLSVETTSGIKDWSFIIKDPKGNDFWTTSGKNQITEKIVWNGLSNVQQDSNGKAERVQSAMDYPFVFTVSDELGMSSTVEGVIPVDVLVIRVGDVLKMAVPSIIFESDSSNFQNESAKLSKEKVDKNLQILDRIAEILKKFSGYSVTIVGHANKITDNPEEETVDNLRQWGRASKPLSKERAEEIKKYLIKKGVKASILSTDGKGGTEPVANPKDKDNNWKNRRVEFILTK